MFPCFCRGIGGYSNSQLFGTSTLSVCKACDMSISDMIKFLSDDREHMKQGTFLDVQQSYLLHSTIGFDEVTLQIDLLIIESFACDSQNIETAFDKH